MTRRIRRPGTAPRAGARGGARRWRAADAPRSPGRPAGATGDRTRARVLAKAIESFAEHGFAGASVRDIARRARIRVSSLYHYFPSKDALFQAVEERMQEELRDLTVSVMSQGLEMREMTREAVGRLFDFYRARPAYVRLGFRIHLDGEAARSYRRVVDRWLGLMDGLMKPAEQRGVIKAVDLPLFLLTVDGLVHWHLASHAFYRSVLGKTLDDPTTAARVREHLIEMVLRTVGLD